MIMKDNSFNEISPTAIQGAYYKTFTDVPYSKEILHEARKYEDLPSDIIIDKHSIIREARHKIVSEFLAKSGISQVFEIAAGYSPRGLIFTEDENCEYVEMDLPIVAENKKKVVNSISKRQNLHILSGNALDKEVFDEATKYFDTKKPVAVVNEGLLRYLTFEEKAILATNIHQLLKHFGGVWVTGDGGFIDFRKNQNNTLPNLDMNMRRRISRNALSNVFNDKQQFDEFFDKVGFTTEFHEYGEMLGDLSSTKTLGVEDDQAKDLSAGAFAVVLRAKNEL